jgi:hypothetical protein
MINNKAKNKDSIREIYFENNLENFEIVDQDLLLELQQK